MSVYIDVNETLKRIQTDYNNSDMPEDWGKGVNFAISRILRQPIADVQPVVKGEWIINEYREVVCSVCGEPNIEYNYCPNCGARMVEE